ncbi:hypothetical protein ABK046_51480, partial [Streptomyces caeruleatus]
GILGGGLFLGGWVRYADGYNRPIFEETVREKRGIGGRLKTRNHYYTVTINAGEDVEGRNEALRTTFRIDVATRELRVEQ